MHIIIHEYRDYIVFERAIPQTVISHRTHINIVQYYNILLYSTGGYWYNAYGIRLGPVLDDLKPPAANPFFLYSVPRENYIHIIYFSVVPTPA